jgi:asparagine synthase (glutamine-hydrolysing)
MCGIFCAINARSLFPWEDFGRFRNLTDLIRYRGPDDSGYLALNPSSPAPVSQMPFQVFLGNRRLSIIDLSSAGHMPMTDGKGRWITYNGEIFNYLELRRELQAQGREFKTSTDTEVILQLYDAYGESGFEKLNGMWAMALVDGPARRVVLSRDRFSIKPLFQVRQGDCFYFASEIKQLLPLLKERAVNREVMSAYLWQGLLDHSHGTFFKDIERIAPRTNFVVSLESGLTSEETYWNYGREENPPEKQVAEKFRELFLDSVRIRLRSDVKLGVLLSGGLDSSAVAVAAGKLLEQPMESFSVVSEHAEFSEERFIDILCRASGIANRKLVFRKTDVLADLESTLDHSDEPFSGFSVIAQYKMFEMIKQETDLTVLLSGQGGDEVLLGYKKFLFFHAKSLASRGKYWDAASVLLQSLRRGTIVRQFRLKEAKRYIPFLQNGRNGHFILMESKPVPVWEFTNMRARQIEDLDRYSVPALTHYEDRNSMAHSLEVRHPFLDHRLVNFSLNLPTERKIHNGWTKYILRESFPEVTPEIRWRKEKQGFITAEELWLREDLSGFIRAQFQKSTLGQMGFVDDVKFLEYHEAFRAGRATVSPIDISRTLIAEVWAARMFRGTVAVAQSSPGN